MTQSAAGSSAHITVRRPGDGEELSVLSLLQSAEERARAPDIRRRLIATLFGRAANVLTVAFAALVCGLAAWARGGNSMAAAVTICEVGVLLARCAVILAFKKRQGATDPTVNIDAWLLRFAALAILSSISWGALCFLCLAFSHDPVLYVIPVLATAGTAGAVAARNSAVPRLAYIQLAMSLLPVMAGSLFTDDHGYRLLLVLVPAMAIGLVILIRERNGQLVDLIETQAELAKLTMTDALTQVPNRRYLDMRLGEALGRAAEVSHPSALLMIDVDNFKGFNDRYGHLAGDALLRQIATVLKDNMRDEHDVVARYGGEEFAILLDAANLRLAASIGERLKEAVETRCRAPDGAFTTISVGVVAFATAMERDAALNAADAALYRAKRAGRNRVETATPLVIAA